MIAWSFSRLTDFESCPYRFQLKYIDKLPEAPNPAAERGTEIHTQYEAFGKGTGPCPSKTFEPTLKTLLEAYDDYTNEVEWAFTKEWEPCSWFDKNAWVRIKPDLHLTTSNFNQVIDYKTGKESRIKHTAQGQLYALGSYIMHPVPKVGVSFFYHDLNTTYSFELTKKQIELLQTQWTKRAQKLDTNRFQPKPSKWNCKYCGMAPHCGYKAL